MASHYFFAGAILSFGTGVLAKSFLNIGFFEFVLLFSLSLFFFLFFALERKTIFLIAGILLFFGALGIFRYELKESVFISPALKEKISKEVVLEAVIIKEPEQKKTYRRLAVGAKKILENSEAKLLRNEKILIIARPYPEFSYGDRIMLKGKLKTPENFSDFDWKNFLAKDDIFLEIDYPEIKFLNSRESSALKTILFSWKNKFLFSLNNVLPEPQSSLLGGIILGAREAMPSEILENLRKAGVIHIVVLSGYNISVVAWAAAVFFGFYFSNRFSIAIAIGIIFLFVILTGAEAPAVRAGIMAGIVFFARLRGRIPQLSFALLLAGFLMLLQNPKILRFDTSFQLSFLATAGLIFLLPRLEKTFSFAPEKWHFKENLLSTISAQIAVTPLLLYAVKQVSIFALAANLLILTAIPFTMFFGFLTGLFGLISHYLALIPGSIVYLLLSYELWVAEIFANLPLSRLAFADFPLYLVILFYALIALFVFFKKAEPQFYEK